MTIPFAVPDVKPLFYDTSAMQGTGFHERLKTLLGVLQKREDQQLAERELRNQEAARLDQAKAGELLAKMIGGMDTVPSITVPSTLMPGAGASVTLPGASGPLANAVRSQPGAAVYEAMGRGQNLVSQYFGDRDKRLLATQKAPAQKDAQITAMDGFWRRVDKATGRATFVTDEMGNPLKADAPAPKTEDLGEYFDSRTNQIVLMPKRAGILPPYLTKAGPITEDERRSADLYQSAVSAIPLAMTLPPISGDLITQLLTAEGSGKGDEQFQTFLRRTKLAPESRRALLAWETVIAAGLYKKTGAALTVSEVLREMNAIPLATNTPEEVADKRARLTDMMTALESGGRRELGTRRNMGGKVPTMADILARVQAEQDAINPDTGSAYSPGNPYAPQPQPGNGSMLRRPR